MKSSSSLHGNTGRDGAQYQTNCEKLWARFGGQLHANAHELRPKLAAIPDMTVYPQNPPTIRIGGQVTKSLYQFTMASPDQEELYASAQSLIGEISRIQGVQDVATDLAIAAPQVTVHIDRDKAAAMQINAQQIENALYDAFGPRWVSTIYGAANEYKVLRRRRYSHALREGAR